MKVKHKDEVRTRNRGGLFEDLGNGWIHLNHEVSLLNDILVSFFNGLVDPLLKLLSTNCEDAVGHVLSRQSFLIQSFSW